MEFSKAIQQATAEGRKQTVQTPKNHLEPVNIDLASEMVALSAAQNWYQDRWADMLVLATFPYSNAPGEGVLSTEEIIKNQQPLKEALLNKPATVRSVGQISLRDLVSVL